MAESTSIEWCDHTFNPWRGCVEVHAGCDHCYARELAKRNPKILGTWGSIENGGTRVIASESQWRQPELWQRRAAEMNRRDRVFCASLADVFETVPAGHPVEAARWRLFRLIDSTPNLDWILVTKRPENVRTMWPDRRPRHNVSLLASVSNQSTLHRSMIPLVRCNRLAPVIGLSIEPLINPIWLRDHADQLDWVIVGGESGPKARDCNPAWVGTIIEHCKEHDVPVFVKQLGTVWSHLEGDGTSKGNDPDYWPNELRLRQFPAAFRTDPS